MVNTRSNPTPSDASDTSPEVDSRQNLSELERMQRENDILRKALQTQSSVPASLPPSAILGALRKQPPASPRTFTGDVELKASNIATFYGVEAFISECMEYEESIKLYDPQVTQPEVIRLLGKCFSGSASLAWTLKRNEIKEQSSDNSTNGYTLTEFYAWLRIAFVEINPVWKRLDLYHSCNQGKRSFAEYYREIATLRGLLYNKPSESEFKIHLRNHASKPLGRKMDQKDADGTMPLRQWVEKAEVLDSHYRSALSSHTQSLNSRNAQQAVQVNAVQSNGFRSNQGNNGSGRGYHGNSTYSNNGRSSNQPYPPRATGNNATPQGHQQARNHYPKQDQGHGGVRPGYDQEYFPYNCHGCGKRGHRKADCRSPATSNNAVSVQTQVPQADGNEPQSTHPNARG